MENIIAWIQVFVNVLHYVHVFTVHEVLTFFTKKHFYFSRIVFLFM